ncbi:MAG: hypothetical protein LC745_09385, partial [Planctomycetia bacterium]|nr:hypothetical protein [Planctomycetia bacterium]
PPADREKYQSVRDAKDWQNPYLVVGADGVVVISKAVLGGRKTVPVRELSHTLLGLPVDAWPYGRVIAIQEAGIRSGDDDKVIEQNKEKAERDLKGLQVKLEWWPSA